MICPCCGRRIPSLTNRLCSECWLSYTESPEYVRAKEIARASLWKIDRSWTTGRLGVAMMDFITRVQKERHK